jgi:hypothetical protein
MEYSGFHRSDSETVGERFQKGDDLVLNLIRTWPDRFGGDNPGAPQPSPADGAEIFPFIE